MVDRVEEEDTGIRKVEKEIRGRREWQKVDESGRYKAIRTRGRKKNQYRLQEVEIEGWGSGGRIK